MVFPSYNVQRAERPSSGKSFGLGLVTVAVLALTIAVVVMFGGELSELSEIDR